MMTICVWISLRLPLNSLTLEPASMKGRASTSEIYAYVQELLPMDDEGE